MRIDLNVPYTDKDEAKALGCRWDAVNKTWFMMAIEDITPYAKWFSVEHAKPNNERVNVVKPKKNKSAKKENNKNSIRNPITVGPNYIKTNDTSTPWN